MTSKFHLTSWTARELSDASDCPIMRSLRPSLLFCLLASVASAQAPGPAPRTVGQQTPDELYQLGRQLYDLAPPEVRARFTFPTKEQWDTFSARLQHALESSSLEELASFAPEARTALQALQTLPGYEDLADWLEQRLDAIEGAGETITPPKPRPPGVPQPPTRPGTSPTVPPALQPVPHYNLWLSRVRQRPVPARAAKLMPTLRAAFVAEGVPPELAWLAEAESSLNPTARSPVGAKGLFQFMPETAKAMGLSTFLPDDRTDPAKSARAAARYLRQLHGRFGNWALALAAYNAGEGRVSRALTKQGGKTFTSIAEILPAETRMYVPKVCALIEIRAGVAPSRIPVPRRI